MGARLAAERDRLGMTQAQLAAALGLSRNSVTLYEADKHQPGADTLSGLHRLGAEVVFILTGDHARSPATTDIDLDRMTVALKEARRQLNRAEEGDERAVLDRAWAIYLAMGSLFAAHATAATRDRSHGSAT